MLSQILLLALASVATSFPSRLVPRATFSGTATFNDYIKQGQTVCGPLTGLLDPLPCDTRTIYSFFVGTGGTFGAAAGDISPDISGGLCFSSIDTSKCNGQDVVSGYQGPACPTGNCGTCYKVTNQGGYGGAAVGGVGTSVTVQIIDSCPSVSAYNYCKTDVPAEERCGAGNSLDIDYNSYLALTGTPWTPVCSSLLISHHS